MLPKKKQVYRNPNLVPNTPQPPRIKPLEPSAELVGKSVMFTFISAQPIQEEQEDGSIQTKFSFSFSDEVTRVTRYEIVTKKGVIIFKHALRMIVVGEEQVVESDNDMGNQ